MTQKEIKSALEGKLRRHFGRDPEDATIEQVYMTCAFFVRDILMEKWVKTAEAVEKTAPKQIYYLSMEFLVGRSLKSNLFNLGLLDDFKKCVKSQFKVDLDTVLDIERDAGLGNGGLGRLAACYQDALATGGYPAWGFSILYEYGIFKQRIVDGEQVELPDEWLNSGGAWLIPNLDETREVRFGGWIEERWENDRMTFHHHDYDAVLAVPHDMFVSGYKSNTVSPLRLWRAKSKETITVPEGVNVISAGAFAPVNGRNEEIKNINLPSTVDIIDDNVFTNLLALENINVTAGGYYQSENGLLYSNNFALLHHCPQGRRGTVEVNKNVVTIYENAFYYNTKAEKVIVPEGVKSIRRGNFVSHGGDGVLELNLPASLTEIYPKMLRYSDMFKVNAPAGSAAQKHAEYMSGK